MSNNSNNKGLKSKSTIESGGDNATMYDKDGLPIYGLDLEIQKKLASKRDPYRETEAQEWIETVTNEKFKDKDFQVSLKDGVLLCNLINCIKPDTIKQVSKAQMAFMQMNNIGHFIRACEKLGVPKHDCFVTIDLYEGKNIPAVVDTIFSLGSICMKLDYYKGPTIGKKRATKTKYEFSDEQIAKAKNTPTKFSEGGKGCASQAGTKSISHEVVKTNDSGIRGSVSKLNEGGHGCASQQGTRSIHAEIVKTNDSGIRGSVSKLNEGGHGCASQQGTRSIKNEVVKIQEKKEEITTENDNEVEVEVKQEEQQEEQVKKEEPQVKKEVEVVVDEDVELAETESDEEDDTSLEELEKLAALKDQGKLTEEEFAAKKKEILGL